VWLVWSEVGQPAPWLPCAALARPGICPEPGKTSRPGRARARPVCGWGPLLSP